LLPHSTYYYFFIASATDDGEYDQIERTKMDGASEEKCTQVFFFGGGGVKPELTDHL
jgi:hypothetical protein